MAILQFGVEAFKDFDGGRLAALIEHELKNAVRDCQDRPGEKKARKVSVTFELKPQDSDKSGVIDGVSLSFQCKLALPTRQSISYSLGLKQNGALFYNEHSPRNHRQGTFETLDEADAAKEND